MRPFRHVPRLRFALATCLLLATGAAAEPPSARVLARYREMLRANPTEGTALDRLWKATVDSGNTAELLAEYRAAQDFPAKMVLGHLLRRAGDPTAAAAFTEATALEAKSPLPHLALGRLQLDEGQAKEAAAHYEKAAALLPEGDARLADTLLALGSAWLAAGEQDRAAEAWEKIAAREPANLALRQRLADQYARHHLPERAVAHLDYLASHGPAPDRAQAAQRLATVHQAAGRVDEAIRALESALAITARGNWLRATLESQLIRLHQRFGRTAELEARWKKTLADNPRDAGAYLQLAEFYHGLGELEQERGVVEGLVRLLPKTAEYRWRLARLLATTDDLRAAANEYDTLLRDQPSNTDLVFERAELEIRQEHPAAAERRIAALLQERKAARKDDESLRAKALDFFREHRLWTQVEATLREEAATSGARESVVAWSQYLFSQHRDDEAEAALRGLVRPGDSKLAQAASLLKTSAALKQQNLLRPALDAAREAAALAADTPAKRREALLAAGELSLTLGDSDTARGDIEEAARLSVTQAETAEADQRLFEILRQLGDKEAVRGRSGPGTPAAELAEQNPAMSRYESNLLMVADQANKEDGWLRLARWQSWCRNSKAAMESVERALLANPNSIPVHEFAVKLAASEPPVLAARRHLEKLVELDPANAGAYRRRLAQLELQAGQTGQALLRLEALAKEHPGNPELLAELATAQQAAEEWSAALATWRRVHALSPPARKRESLAPLLRICERSGQHRPAAELLLDETAARTDAKEKRELFGDLLAHCLKHSLLPWLHARWEERRRRQPDDFFTEVSFSEIQKAEGDRAGAFDTLSRALFTDPDPASALPELVRQAEDLRRFDAAIDFQKRFTRLGPQNRPEHLQKLADLQEKEFDLPGAEASWEQVIHRFPRDPDALQRAAEFHRRLGNTGRAAEILRRVRGLDGLNVATAYKLAQLDLENGHVAEAEQALEEILRAPSPSAEGEAFAFPAMKPGNAGRLQSEYLAAVRQRKGKPSPETMQALRGFWIESPTDGRTERDRRLNAIRDLASLIRGRENPALLAQWLARWNAEAEERPNESLWAFYYAGATDPALDLLEKLMAREPANETLQQGYIWLALQLGGYARLGQWTQDRGRTVKQRDFFRIGLAQYLRSQGPQVPKALLDGLYPADARGRLWEGAELCAANGSFREAIALGSRALATDGPLRSEHRLQLAHWRICLGDVPAAQRQLATLARTPAEGFESPVFTAMREAYLLLPEAERRTFADNLEHELAHGAPPVHAALARLLLFGLIDDKVASQAQLRQLLGMRVIIGRATEEIGDSNGPRLSPGGRSWSFLLSTGLHLQVWKLEHLAASLWEYALADRAMLRLEGEQAQELAREARARLFALRLTRTEPVHYEQVILEYTRGVQQLEGAVALGEALESMGALPPALAVFRRLWEKEPGNPQFLRNVLNVCRLLEDYETTEAVLTRCVAERLYALNDNVQRDLITQLVDSLERRQAFPAAQAILEQAIETAPYDSRLLQRQAQLFEKAGRPVDAETAWRRLISIEPGHIAGRIGLATLLEGQNKYAAAVSVLQKNTPSGAEAQFARLCVLNGQLDEAAAAVERLVGPLYFTAVQTVAPAMIAQAQPKAARSLLQTALGRNPDPATAMTLQGQVLESLGPKPDPLSVRREMKKLRRLADDDSARLGLYFSFAQLHAREFGIEPAVAAELEAAWADGVGLLQAGMVLLSWHLDRGLPAGERVLDQLLSRPEINEQTLQILVSPLLTAKRPDLAAKVQQRLVAINPLEDARVVSLIDFLEQAGRRDDSTAALEKWGARASLSDDFAAKVATLWVKLGRPERAEPLFAQVTRAPFARSAEACLAHARLCLARGDLPAARRLLRHAFRFPANRSFDDLAAWAEAAQKLEQAAEVAAEFSLTPAQTLGFHTAIFAAWERKQDPTKAAAHLASLPALLQTGQPGRLRSLAAARSDFAPAAEALRLLSTQATPPLSDEAGRELTLLLAAWADADLLANRPAEALLHLTEAHARQPELWWLAEKLAKLHRTNSEPEKAGAVVARFLSVAKDPVERQKAERFLMIREE